MTNDTSVPMIRKTDNTTKDALGVPVRKACQDALRTVRHCWLVFHGQCVWLAFRERIFWQNLQFRVINQNLALLTGPIWRNRLVKLTPIMFIVLGTTQTATFPGVEGGTRRHKAVHLNRQTNHHPTP